MTANYAINDRISTTDNHLGTVKFVGTLPAWGESTLAYGIEWDDPKRGKNNGDVAGVQYFVPTIPGSGSFVKSSNRMLNNARKSFVDVIQEKYLDSEYVEQNIKFGSKIVEELGWEKLNTFQADLKNLKSLTLDHCLIATAFSNEGGQIFTNLSNLTNLELSSNLFTDLNEVPKIVDQLPSLVSLNINGNRFNEFSNNQIEHANIKSLKVSGTMMSLSMLDKLLKKFPNLEELYISGNNYYVNDIEKFTFPPKITVLDLSYNQLTSIPSNVHSMVALNVSHNNLSSGITDKVFSNIITLDMRANKLSSWNEIDSLSRSFPNLKDLKINHNPLFESISIDDMTAQLIGRFDCSKNHLRKLNGSFLTEDEITNGELYFISKVQQGVFEINNDARWSELLAKYGKQETTETYSSMECRDWIDLVILTPDSKKIPKKFSKKTSILQFKGVISQVLDNVSILDFKAYYYTHEYSTFAEKNELEDFLSTLDSYSLTDNQNIYIDIDTSN
ncbi:PAC2 Protein PAC2 [Candida maltosa Xu316]